jgi:hypothetical protein
MSAKYCDATRAIGAWLAELAEALGERLEWSLQRQGDGAGARLLPVGADRIVVRLFGQ